MTKTQIMIPGMAIPNSHDCSLRIRVSSLPQQSMKNLNESVGDIAIIDFEGDEFDSDEQQREYDFYTESIRFHGSDEPIDTFVIRNLKGNMDDLMDVADDLVSGYLIIVPTSTLNNNG